MSKSSDTVLLFLDDDSIARMENISREIQQPVKHQANPVLRREYPWEESRVHLYGSVLWDDENNLFRMWYMSIHNEHQMLAYAESEDGVHWHKPKFNIREYEGHRETNILLGPDVNIHGPCVIRNPLPDDPKRRFLLLFDSYSGLRPDEDNRALSARWLYSAFSQDGIHWNPPKGHPAFPAKSDTGQSVVWDPERKVFRAYIRGFDTDCYNGRGVRLVRMTESQDFIKWSSPIEVFRADEIDGPPDNQPYGMSVTYYCGIYIGMLWMLHIRELEPRQNEFSAPPLQIGSINVQLVSSRDSIHWQRVGNRQVFLDNGRPDEWDSEMLFTASQFVVHDEKIWLYYSGSSIPHGKGANTDIGLAILPIDRFVALRPKKSWGIIETKPFCHLGDSLQVNADATGGQILIEALDVDGRLVPGFTKSESIPIQKDTLQHEIQWECGGHRYGLLSLRSRISSSILRLRVYLLSARLYSLRVCKNRP